MTRKVLLTLPIRAVLGSIGLIFCGFMLLIGMTIKVICVPTEPVFDYKYRSADYEPAWNVSWLRSFQWWCKWIVYGTAD